MKDLQDFIEYLTKEEGTQTFYRVREKDDSFLQTQFKSMKRKKLSKILRDLVFGRIKTNSIFVKRTKPILYPHKGKLYEMCDIVSVSLDESRVKKEFKMQIQLSRKLKEKLLEEIKEELVPFLSELFNSNKHILAFILRGELNRPDRFVNPYTDVDVLVLVDFNLSEKELILELLRSLKKFPARETSIEIHPVKPKKKSITQKPLYNGRNSSEGLALEFDIMNYFDVMKLADIWLKEKKKIPEYEVKDFLHARVLLERKNFGQSFIQKILLLS